jgi:outer membrane protein TolC
VKTQFYNVLAARESEAAARIQLEQARQQLRVSILQLRGGKATKSDSLRSVIQLREAQLAVEQAMVDLATSNLRWRTSSARRRRSPPPRIHPSWRRFPATRSCCTSPTRVLR